jgi:poly(A) polymerase Pap1
MSVGPVLQSQRYLPLYDPINTNEPTPTDLKIDLTLKAYMDTEMKLETDEEMRRRASVLKQVEAIFLNWVKKVAIETLHLPEDEALAAGGKLFISGSVLFSLHFFKLTKNSSIYSYFIKFAKARCAGTECGY